MEKETCEICKRDFPKCTNKCLRTEDNKVICLDCHYVVFNNLFKGLYTMDEANKVITFENTFKETLEKYLLLFRKYAIYNNDTSDEMISKIYKEEDRVSMETFKKSRQAQCFHKEGHLEILPLVKIENIYKPLDFNIMTSIPIDTDHRDIGYSDLYYSSIIYNKYINIDNLR